MTPVDPCESVHEDQLGTQAHDEQHRLVAELRHIAASRHAWRTTSATGVRSR